MKEIFFATGNAHKLEEIEKILGNRFTIHSFQTIDQKLEIEETEDSLDGNALLKVRAYYNLVKMPAFAEDTGLEVDALGGFPGVYTARYAGPDADAESNMQKLLTELHGQKNRSAQFRTVIAWKNGDSETLFEGILKGSIAFNKQGDLGFGYDPVFIPEGHEQTLAELGSGIKNQISHRARAVAKLVAFLE